MVYVTYCGGSRIQAPAADVCSYLACVADFWQGEGHMIQCGDGTVGMVGGRTGTCPQSQGRKQPVYAPK